MSEHESDLRQLVRNVVKGDLGRDPAQLWADLCQVGVAEVAVTRPEAPESGDLWDLAACVDELAAAGRSAPLLERAVARWVAGDSLDEGVRAIVATGTVDRVDDALHGSVVARWGHDADVIVVLSADASPAMVDTRGQGVELDNALNIAGEPVATLTFLGAHYQEVPGVTAAAATARLRVLRSAALTGVSRAMYEQTRTFVGQREQFGGPLLRIPAVASNLAVMRTWLEQSAFALRRVDEVMRYGTDQEVDTAALIARLLASQGSTEVARIAHQLHGAIGVTAEFGLHHLAKRVWAWRDADWRERDLAVELGRRSVTVPEAAFWDSVTA